MHPSLPNSTCLQEELFIGQKSILCVGRRWKSSFTSHQDFERLFLPFERSKLYVSESNFNSKGSGALSQELVEELLYQ